MKTEDGATKAVKHLHNMDFFGNNITVKFSTSGVHKAPGVEVKENASSVAIEVIYLETALNGGKF